MNEMASPLPPSLAPLRYHLHSQTLPRRARSSKARERQDWRRDERGRLHRDRQQRSESGLSLMRAPPKSRGLYCNLDGANPAAAPTRIAPLDGRPRSDGLQQMTSVRSDLWRQLIAVDWCAQLPPPQPVSSKSSPSAHSGFSFGLRG